MPKPKTIVQEHRQNFETLKRAFADGNVLLMECQEVATGETVAVICASTSEKHEYTQVPFAMFFNGNPYEMLRAPNPDGGFFPATSEETGVKKTNLEMLKLAEQALGENLTWICDQVDLQVRQKDPETLRRLQQMNDAWVLICQHLGVK